MTDHKPEGGGLRLLSLGERLCSSHLLDQHPDFREQMGAAYVACRNYSYCEKSCRESSTWKVSSPFRSHANTSI